MKDEEKLKVYDISDKFIATCSLMFEQKFVLKDAGEEPPEELPHGAVYGQIITMSDDVSLELLLLCSVSCGAKLAGRIFECNLTEVDQLMARDAIGEMLNVLAGQIKTDLASTHAIGLPVAYDTSQEFWRKDRTSWRGHYLSAPEHDINVWLALRESRKGKTDDESTHSG